MYNPPEPPPPAPSSGDPGSRGARYAYLVGRLRSRQITMEEATELFNLMQVTLSRSEAARLAAMAQMSAARSTTAVRPPPPPPGMAVASNSDEFLMLGLLAMGAGVGLVAALTKRVQELSVPPASPEPTDKVATPR